MSIVYDEVWITTMREIEICRYSLKKYEAIIKKMEGKYGITTEEFLKRYKDESFPENKVSVRDFKKWYDIYLAREKCSLRKKELESFLER